MKTATDFLQGRAFGVLLVAASILALLLSVFTSYKADAYARCQSAVFDQLVMVSTARADAAEQDRRSDREESQATALLIQGVFAGTTTAERLAVYDAYVKTLADINADRDAAAKERAAHPLPGPPSQTCA
jgi:hypothetical protein